MSQRSYSEEEKNACVEEFKESGQSIKGFAKAKDVPESTFRGWLKADEDISFGRIEINSLNTGISTFDKDTIVFVYENIKIELKENFNKELLKQIVEVLAHA